LLASKTARMKKERQEENVALISGRMSIQQRHSSVGPMPSHQPYGEQTVDLSISHEGRDRALRWEKLRSLAPFLLIGITALLIC
jgi:hypothetical protein